MFNRKVLLFKLKTKQFKQTDDLRLLNFFDLVSTKFILWFIYNEQRQNFESLMLLTSSMEKGKLINATYNAIINNNIPPPPQKRRKVNAKRPHPIVSIRQFLAVERASSELISCFVIYSAISTSKESGPDLIFSSTFFDMILFSIF